MEKFKCFLHLLFESFPNAQKYVDFIFETGCIS